MSLLLYDIPSDKCSGSSLRDLSNAALFVAEEPRFVTSKTCLPFAAPATVHMVIDRVAAQC